MTRRIPIAAFLAIGTLLGASGCATWGPPRHPEFKLRHAQLQTIGVLPANIEVYKVTFSGEQQMMYELLPALRKQAEDEVRQVLAKRGYRVSMLDLGDQVLAADPELKRGLHTLDELFAKQLEEYHRRWFPKASFKYSLGSEVNPFADRANSEALVILRAQGVKKTGGEIAKDVTKTVLIAAATLGGLFMYHYPSVTLVQLAVVDGDTGDLLWLNENTPGHAGQGGFDIAREACFRKEIRNLLSAFPKAVAVNKQEAPRGATP